MRRRTVTLICIALVAAGTLLLIAGGLPYERLQSYGALVRRADDFTPERFARFRHVCWFFAVACAGLALWLWRAKPQARIVAGDQAGTRCDRGGWLLWLIVVVGVALRLQRLFDPVAYDEAYTFLNFASRPWYEAIGDYNSTNNHLLNTLLMHVSTRIFGPQEWALRWHVLLAGSVLPIAVYVWAKEWLGRPVGLIAAGAVAVSPMLITYSTDARGYMLVALAAIVFDLSLGRLTRTVTPLEPPGPSSIEPRGLSPRPMHTATSDSLDQRHRRAWWLAWGALVFGLCSMPLMVYAAVGSAAWFVLSPLDDRRAAIPRIRTIASIGLLALPAVAAFYAPAYIFRGMMFLNDPIVRAADAGGFGSALQAAWVHAFAWWTDGIVPGWFWGPAAVAGVIAMPSVDARLRWSLPFVVVLALNIVQHVAPPPRIYMHLAPWLFVAAAFGFQWLLTKLRRRSMLEGAVLALLLLGLGSAYACTRPVLFNAGERADFQSVPDAIAAVQAVVQQTPGEHSILLAPLPCDLPSLFYLRRSGGELPVNPRPEPGDVVYLIARPQETPQQVLATPLLDMADLAPQFDAWQQIADYRTLTLYVSQIPADRQ